MTPVHLAWRRGYFDDAPKGDNVTNPYKAGTEQARAWELGYRMWRSIIDAFKE